MMPARAAGSTTPMIIRHWGTPRASAASRRVCGTRRSTSSTVRRMIGTMITARATAPARPEKLPITVRTSQAQTKTPMTIDGIPAMRSELKRMALAKRPRPYSER